jgi:UDP-2,3-diacylglucosamine pyrophosphatase LpxH
VLGRLLQLSQTGTEVLYIPGNHDHDFRKMAGRDICGIRRFEEIAARTAGERGFDGIVCGHIHRPCVREINGIHYANDGDWVEHRTALAESDDGQLQVLQWLNDEVVIEPAVRIAPLAA